MELSQLQLSESKQQSHQSARKQRKSNIEHLSLHLTYDDREFEQLEAIPFARPMRPAASFRKAA